MGKISKRNKGSFNTLKFLGYTTILAVMLLISAQFVHQKFFSYQIECANTVSCINDLSGLPSADRKGVYMGKKVEAPDYLAEGSNKKILGVTTEKKHIYIDLAHQHLYAYEGERVAFDFPISSGKWAKTPTGDFEIWTKLRYTRMIGGDSAAGTFYNLSNVPYVMYFYSNSVSKTQGYSLNGDYWQTNFGHPMTYGGIDMSETNAEKLFNWSGPTGNSYSITAQDYNPGTPITIYGQTPEE